MYSKQEAAQLKGEFWTAFGQYMAPVLSADGEKVSWANYKTGEKNIRFRLHADNKTAGVAIELTHPDDGIRQLYFDQFLQLKKVLEATTGEEWTWRPQTTGDWGKTMAAIGTQLHGVSILRHEDWPKLISFFKPRLVALDEFWSGAKYSFEALR